MLRYRVLIVSPKGRTLRSKHLVALSDAAAENLAQAFRHKHLRLQLWRGDYLVTELPQKDEAQ